MRFFPSAGRHRASVACLALVSVAALTAPFAVAGEDDLRDRKRALEERIDAASDDLQETSRGVARATIRLQDTLARLATARTELTDVRARLATARTRDAQIAVELEQAEQALADATEALGTAAAEADAQREVVRNTTISIYAEGDSSLQAVSELLSAGSLEEIEDRRLGQQVLSNEQTTVYDDLEEVEQDLTEQRAEVARTTEAVEAKRVEAAEHLVDMQALVVEARDATERVRGLVVEARVDRQAAFAARARDREVLRGLRQRERAIERRLVALARSQRDQIGYRGASGTYLDYPTGAGVTSPYGFRTHPIYGYYALHNGIDFGADCGAPLRASAGGTVIDTFSDAVFGKRLFLSLGKVNGRSLVLVYNHMSGFRAQEGDRLERGTVLGYSGATGWSTGCHLHFTVMENGAAVDPMKYL